MSLDVEQIPVSDEVLALMRNAASRALANDEKFISPRAMMVALMHDQSVAEALKEAVDVDALETLTSEAIDKPSALEVPEDRMTEGEQPALLRYDTLAFKDETGQNSVWLNGEAYAVFLEGARRTEGRYMPKHLALGFASEARKSSSLLTDLKIDPAKFSEAAFKL